MADNNKDIFGFNKTAHTQEEISTPSALMVAFGSAAGASSMIRLVQSANLTYQRSINPTMELGSEDIWVSASPASGTLQLSRAVGISQMLRPYVNNPCGESTIVLGKGNADCTFDPGIIVCGGCIGQSATINAQAGQHIITDGMTYNVATVSYG